MCGSIKLFKPLILTNFKNQLQGYLTTNFVPYRQAVEGAGKYLRAEDALILDNTHMDREMQLDYVLKLLKEKELI